MTSTRRPHPTRSERLLTAAEHKHLPVTGEPFVRVFRRGRCWSNSVVGRWLGAVFCEPRALPDGMALRITRSLWMPGRQ